MSWRDAIITLVQTQSGLAGTLTAGEDLSIELRHWRRHESGLVRCQISIDDPSWQAYLARLLQSARV